MTREEIQALKEKYEPYAQTSEAAFVIVSLAEMTIKMQDKLMGVIKKYEGMVCQ